MPPDRVPRLGAGTNKGSADEGLPAVDVAPRGCGTTHHGRVGAATRGGLLGVYSPLLDRAAGGLYCQHPPGLILLGAAAKAVVRLASYTSRGSVRFMEFSRAYGTGHRLRATVSPWHGGGRPGARGRWRGEGRVDGRVADRPGAGPSGFSAGRPSRRRATRPGGAHRRPTRRCRSRRSGRWARNRRRDKVTLDKGYADAARAPAPNRNYRLNRACSPVARLGNHEH